MDNKQQKKNSTISDDNTLKEQVAAVISSVIHNVEKAFIPCLDRLDEHLDQILEGTELELNPSATPKKPGPGPVPLFQRFPEIITEANTFLTDNGLAAHSRRRSDTSDSMGTCIRNASVSQVGTPEQQAIAKEFVMTVMHMDRRANFGMLCKCEVASCLYCTAHPVQLTTTYILYQFLETNDHFCFAQHQTLKTQPSFSLWGRHSMTVPSNLFLTCISQKNKWSWGWSLLQV